MSKLFIAAVEGANVGPVPGVNPDVCPKVKVQRETLPAALERALDGEKHRTVRDALHRAHKHMMIHRSTDERSNICIRYTRNYNVTNKALVQLEKKQCKINIL